MNATELEIDIEKLRRLIGREVLHQGRRCRIIEVLEEGPSLILQHLTHHTTIQPDQHGEARRRVPATETIEVRDGEQLSDAFAALNVVELLR